MHAKLSLFLVAAATIAAALPGKPAGGDANTGGSADPSDPAGGTGTVWNKVTKKCNVGKLQCCQQVQKATDSAAASQLGLLGIAVGTITALVGLDCNPISVIGVGGNNCAAQPVCCKGNNFKGAVVLGCTPVNVNL